MLKAKTFIAALNSFHKNGRKNKKILLDKRLSQLEKNIFQSQIWLSDSKFELIIGTLEDYTTSGDAIIDSQSELLLGSALSNSGQPTKAIRHLKRALTLLENSGLERQIFIVLTNLYNCYYNLKSENEMKSVIESIKPYSGISIDDELNMLSCQFSYFTYIQNKPEALKIMKRMEAEVESMSEYQRSTFLFDQFDFYFKFNDYQACNSVLDKMKNLKKYHTGYNFKFMRGLLDHLTKDAPIYLYEKHFEKSPILLNQLRVLKCLEAHDLKKAEHYWSILALSQPKIYQKNFNYCASKCLFSECLKKYIYPVAKNVDFDSTNKLEVLHFLLISATAPLSKEYIYKAVYGHELDNKENLNKLNQLIVRLKQNMKLSIKSKKGCYILEKKSA
jgi:hypothetical protein